MNRAERRRQTRQGDRAIVEVEIFGHAIADNTVRLTTHLPVLAQAVEAKTMTFNPAIIEMLEKLDGIIHTTLEVLRKEGDESTDLDGADSESEVSSLESQPG